MKTKIPNLFRDYATSELSQDAFICWLLAWAGYKSDDPEHEELRRCGRKLVLDLLNRDKDELPEEFGIDIHKQDKGIDVLALIDNKHVLLIEDKTTTGTYGDQLERYYDHVEGGRTKLGAVKQEDIYRIYFKTGNQSRAENNRIERETGYRVFLREDFLRVLDRYESDNAILSDYRYYLQDLEDRTNSYKKWREGSPMSWEAWEGFYRRLEGEVDNFDWSGYVHNQSGGFQGFTWFPVDNFPDFPVGLVIEGEEKLCFKVWAEAAGVLYEDWSQFREDWSYRIIQVNKEQVDRPKRMGHGKVMTVAKWKENWMAFGENNGFLDVEGTVANLKRAEKVLRSAQALAKAQAP